MKGKQLKLFIKRLVVNPIMISPSQRTSLCGRKVFHGMEGKRSKISDLATHLSMPFGTKSMSGIRKYDNPTVCLLDIVRWRKQMFLALYGSEYLIIITNHTGKINRQNHLCPLRDRICQLIIIHLKRIRSGIHHDNLCPHMTSYTCGSGIRISGSNHLVSLSNAQNTQYQLHTSRSRIQAYSLLRLTTQGN